MATRLDSMTPGGSPFMATRSDRPASALADLRERSSRGQSGLDMLDKGLAGKSHLQLFITPAQRLPNRVNAVREFIGDLLVSAAF
jgi:hypothetical protein